MIVLGLNGRSSVDRSRLRAARALFCRYRRDCTPEGRADRLLEQWLSATQKAQLASSGYFEVVGSDTGHRYRIYPGTSMNVIELDSQGRVHRGLCFLPLGELPTGDVMLAQKLALEASECRALTIAKEFAPQPRHVRATRPRR
jgi:hypothetical protein